MDFSDPNAPFSLWPANILQAADMHFPIPYKIREESLQFLQHCAWQLEGKHPVAQQVM